MAPNAHGQVFRLLEVDQKTITTHIAIVILLAFENELAKLGASVLIQRLAAQPPMKASAPNPNEKMD